MNFIIKLLKSKDLIISEVFNLIIVIYNKFNKYVIIILIKEIYKAE